MCSSRSEQTLTMSDSESDFSNDCVSVGGEDSSGDTGDSSSDSDDNPGTSFSKRSRFDMEIPDPDSYDPGRDDRVAQRERQHGQEGAARRRPLWEASKQASLLSTPSSSRPDSPQPLLGRLTPSLLGANTGSLSTPSHDSQAGTSRQRTVQGPLGGAERPDTPPIANLSVQPEARWWNGLPVEEEIIHWTPRAVAEKPEDAPLGDVAVVEQVEEVVDEDVEEGDRRGA